MAGSERLRVAILDAARKRFTSIGYERTSMDQVATDAGVSKRTIYCRFGAKAELFRAVVDHLGHKRLDEIEAVEVPEGTPAEVLTALSRKLIEMSLIPEVIELERMSVDMSHDFPELLEIRAGHSERMIAIIVRHLETLRRSKPASPDQLKHDARIFLSMTLLPRLHWAMMRRGTQACDDDAHLARVVEIFLNGYD